MTLIDAHAHSYYDEEDIECVKYEDGCIVIENGIDSITNQKCLDLSKKYPFVKAALGWHPSEAVNEQGFLKALEEIKFIKKNKKNIVAIGEIGLDFYHHKDDPSKHWQNKVFVEYINLASALNLPIIVHARNSVKEVLETLEKSEFKGKVVMHCMEASSKNIQIAIDRGYYFTIPASVGRNEMFQRLVSMVPISKMLTETDAPFQGPVKGKKAKSSDVKYAIKYIAKEQGLDEKEVESIIYMNYNKVF